MHSITSLLYMFQWSMQAKKNYTYVSEKSPIYIFSRSKTSKCSKHRVTDIQEKPVDFFYVTAWMSTLAPKIILLTEVPLQWFSFLWNLWFLGFIFRIIRNCWLLLIEVTTPNCLHLTINQCSYQSMYLDRKKLLHYTKEEISILTNSQ